MLKLKKFTTTPYTCWSHHVLQDFGFVCVNTDDFFEFRVSKTHRHSYKLYQQFINCISPSQFLLRTCCLLRNSFSEDRANFSCLHIIFKSSLKSTNLMSLVHWSLYVPSLCYYVHGYFCVCMFQWATVGADIECSTMFLLCFYCLCLRMLSK